MDQPPNLPEQRGRSASGGQIELASVWDTTLPFPESYIFEWVQVKGLRTSPAGVGAVVMDLHVRKKYYAPFPEITQLAIVELKLLRRRYGPEGNWETVDTNQSHLCVEYPITFYSVCSLSQAKGIMRSMGGNDDDVAVRFPWIGIRGASSWWEYEIGGTIIFEQQPKQEYELPKLWIRYDPGRITPYCSTASILVEGVVVRD
ncbi:hypothetical protein VTN31DRAFT_3385 [Thermomyces dupontii]|uniref:uncharacterized protein n=1 Tax=Talaromyces thermophilus TaxID=28565 RepID=UPI003743D0F9